MTRPLLINPEISKGAWLGAQTLENGAFPHGDVPAVLAYADWVESKWPADILELMGGQHYDGVTDRAKTLYRSLIAKRAYDIRVKGASSDAVAYAPGTFAEVGNLPIQSYVAGKDAAGNDLAVITKAEAPAGGYFLNALGNLTSEEAKGAVTDAYGIDPNASWLSLPGEVISKALKPLMWIAIVAGLLFLAFKLPDFSGVKIKANIGGSKKKVAK